MKAQNLPTKQQPACAKCGYQRLGYANSVTECPECQHITVPRQDTTQAQYKVVTMHSESQTLYYVLNKEGDPVASYQTRDAANARAARCNRPRRVPVLCGCGWGSLAMLESEVPEYCPVCGGDLLTHL